MATINSVTNGGQFHFNDPTAWSGGSVPGKGDSAVIAHTFTLINSGSGYHYWSGVKRRIVVDSTTGFASTSGSFYTYTYPGTHKIQVMYDSLDSNEFFYCRISSSYANGKGESPTWEAGYSGSFVGILRNDTPVFTEPTTIYVSSSAEWHVDHIRVHDQGRLIIKDNAHLALDSSTRDSYIGAEDGDIQIIGNVTCSLTGSTERNSGLIQHDDIQWSNVLVSGSSDLRARTEVKTAAAAGAGKILVNDESGFGVGDFISIYHESKDNYKLQISPDANNTVEYYSYGSNPSSHHQSNHPIGTLHTQSNVYPNNAHIQTKDNNEVMQVVKTATDTLYVKKMYAREGKVVATNSLSRQAYLRTRGFAKSFSGNRVILEINSGHNTFREGDTIVTDTGVVATILKIKDKLRTYKDIDFATDNDPLQHFIIDPFIGSGSNIDYRATSHLITGSYGLSIGVGNDSYGDAFGTSTSRYRRIFLKDTKMRDVKVTISGSQFGGPEDSAYSDTRMVGVQIQQCPYLRSRVMPFYGMPDDSPGPYIGIYSDDVWWGKESGDYLQFDTDGAPWSDTPQRTKPSTMIIDSLRTDTSYHWNGHKVGCTVHNGHSGGITLNLRGYDSTIRSMKVEEYVQEVLLDTTAAIPVGTTIYETGTEVAHTTEQKVVKLAYSIKDIRGYENLLAVYANHYTYNDSNALASGSIPTFFSNEGDKIYHQTSTTTDARSRIGAMFYHDNDDDLVFRTKNSGDREFVLNLGEPTTFDALTINGRYFNSYRSRTATLNGFGIEVSNDGVSYSVVREQANDTRKPRGQAGTRMFTFTEVTARFLKIKLNGGSASANNYISHLGLYHFNGRGSTIELNDASHLEVGNTISIMQSSPGIGEEYAYANYGEWRTAAKAGTESDANYVGGFDHNYKITAINGNVITLNKNIESQTVRPDDIVVKLDRSIMVKSDNYIPFGPYYANNNDSNFRFEYYNAAFMNMGNGSRERMYLYSHSQTGNCELSNCVFNYMEQASMYSNDGGKVDLNNVYNNMNTWYQRGSRKYSTTITHGNLINVYYIIPRVMIGLGMTFTGNLCFSTRYILLHYHSGPEQPSNNGTNIFRNNYFRFNDYYEKDATDVGALAYNSQDYAYFDNVINLGQGQGYMRDIGMHQDVMKSKHRNESANIWPPIYLSPIRTNNHTNFNTKRQSTGNDGQYTANLIPGDCMETGYEPTLRIGAGRSTYRRKPGTKEEFQFIAEHHNRNAQPVFACKFHVFETQPVRVNTSFDYYMDKGIVYNDRSADEHFMRIMVVDPDGRTIGPAETISPSEFPYTTHTFEKFIPAAKPGPYLVVINQFSYLYAGVMMYYKNTSCQIKGGKPSAIQVLMNGFYNHQLMMDKSKIDPGGGLTIGTEAFIDNPTRTTVKFRSIRF